MYYVFFKYFKEDLNTLKGSFKYTKNEKPDK